MAMDLPFCITNFKGRIIFILSKGRRKMKIQFHCNGVSTDELNVRQKRMMIGKREVHYNKSLAA